MSKKPTIRIVYPDASPIAMLLTEAMVRRASGKRVVETESMERESAGQDLFAGSLCCVTETSVELTLNLAPEAMDFALATLIAKNLTQAERDKAMEASDSLELDALFTPRAGEPSAPANEPTKEEQEAPSFSYQTYAEIGLILAALEFVPRNKKTASTINFLKDMAEITKKHLRRNRDEWEGDFVLAKEHADIMLHDTPPTAADPEKMITDLTGILYNNDHVSKKQEPSWDDMEKEAQSLGKKEAPDE